MADVQVAPSSASEARVAAARWRSASSSAISALHNDANLMSEASADDSTMPAAAVVPSGAADRPKARARTRSATATAASPSTRLASDSHAEPGSGHPFRNRSAVSRSPRTAAVAEATIESCGVSSTTSSASPSTRPWVGS